MTRLILLSILCLALPLIQSCVTTPKKTVFRDDPLIGKIIRTQDRARLSFADLVDDAAGHDVIFLSEKHDNPMHHAIQHRIIQQLTDKGLTPIIGFEFFAMDHTPLILNFIDSGRKKHSKEIEAVIEKELRKRLNWDRQSDTMWAYYFNLLKLARDNQLLAAGLDLDESQKRRITRKGMDDLTQIEKDLLFSTNYDNPVYEAHMKSIFKAVHCGMGHDRMTDRLYAAWLARNDKMAKSITQLAKAEKKPVVVIMGNGHTEYGLGVMDRVAALAPDLSQTNIAIAEIFREPAGLDTYLEPLELEGFAPVPPADYIWLTQRVSYEDPCEKFKASLEKMKPAGKKEKKEKPE